jgi:NAD(P)H-dependent nitrite reductase small subunit
MVDSPGWQRVAALSELPEDEPFSAKLDDAYIALYRLNGQIYALDDVCTHEFALLSQGFIEDCAIECPLHQARFDIATGRCLSPPATEDVRSYEVRVEGNDVFVNMTAKNAAA